jgi:hypothetical protein
MTERHDRVARAVAKAIEKGNPGLEIREDKSLVDIVKDSPKGRRPGSDLVFEAATKKGRKTINSDQLVEITTSWPLDGRAVDPATS